MKKLELVERIVNQLNNGNKDFSIIINDYDIDCDIIVIDAINISNYDEKVLSIRIEDGDLILFETLTDLTKFSFQNEVKRFLSNYTKLLNDIKELSDYLTK